MDDNRPLWQRQRDALRAEADAADAEDLFAVADQVEQETVAAPLNSVVSQGVGDCYRRYLTRFAEPNYCAPWPDAITKYPLPATVQYEVRMVLNLRTPADDLHELEAMCDALKAGLLRALAGLERP